MNDTKNTDPMPVLKHPYAGAFWVQKHLEMWHERRKRVAQMRGRAFLEAEPIMSPLGQTVAEILGFVYAGIYHLPLGLIAKANWFDPLMVRISVPNNLSTFDNDVLTSLVVVCHDMMVRMEVSSANQYYIRLGFSQRTKRCGVFHEIMPTMEVHTEMIRSNYDVFPKENLR